MKNNNIIAYHSKTKGILAIFFTLFLISLSFFGLYYYNRITTIYSIEKITGDSSFNLYSMEVKYPYSLDAVIQSGITDDQTNVEAIVNESFPFLPISIDSQSMGCSAFAATTVEQQKITGRNYDYNRKSSSIIVYCHPKNGYKSIATIDLGLIGSNFPDTNIADRIFCVAAPFICEDGINEKGVSISVLMAGKIPVFQKTGHPVITTTLFIRLILDKAATTQEAVALAKQYDMLAVSGSDYQFFISDASGDACIMGYNPDTKESELKVTKGNILTNFYPDHIDNIVPNQRNPKYGHGLARYNKMELLLERYKDTFTINNGWEVLQAASLKFENPNNQIISKYPPSTTLWSILYNNTEASADYIFHNNWNEIYHCTFKDGSFAVSKK